MVSESSGNGNNTLQTPAPVEAENVFCLCLHVNTKIVFHGKTIRKKCPFWDFNHSFCLIGKVITERKCFFRCYKAGRNNCYNVPRCKKTCKLDHGVEIMVNIKSTGYDKPAAGCNTLISEIANGTIGSGRRVIRDGIL